MISNYLIYLNSLPNEQKNQQLFIILKFFTVLFLICVFLDFLKRKFRDETKDTVFQRFLKKLRQRFSLASNTS